MRFRAQLRQVRVLVQVLTVIQRVNRNEAVFKLSARRLLFICSEGGAGKCQVLCSVKTTQVMEAMRIESKMNDEIYLKVDVGTLLRVLKGAERAKDVTIKLGVTALKKPVLQICMVMKGTASHDVIQEIPVGVMTEEEVGDIDMPECAGLGSNTVSLFLPPIVDVRPFIERMGKIADKLTLTADTSHSPDGVTNGVLEIRTQTPLFSSASQYRSLTIGKPCDSSATLGVTTATCIVDCKKFLSLLEIDKISPTQVLMHFTDSHSLVVQASAFEELSVVFVIPCVS
eukprot:TRINITY_DN2566_c1_g1_i4.p1 TRINITY_DN2566_c1_g1~~TRINITY_DN2566_c1_g1_i4.p1  ORF type:complete len:285 (+),score=52.74 TRINITY_DN2566_c1_g1_i4:323-1177(+)